MEKRWSFFLQPFASLSSAKKYDPIQYWLFSSPPWTKHSFLVFFSSAMVSFFLDFLVREFYL